MSSTLTPEEHDEATVLSSLRFLSFSQFERLKQLNTKAGHNDDIIPGFLHYPAVEPFRKIIHPDGWTTHIRSCPGFNDKPEV